MAPTIIKQGSYRFFFYSGDKYEPVHVHVERDNCVAKFWIDPILLHSSHGFRRNELIKIEKIIKVNEEKIKEAWYDYFGN